MRRKQRAADPALHRFSEPFPPHGALAAEGAANLLGRPRLDPLVVLVREAVQNSWDARRPDADVVHCDLGGHHLDRAQAHLLRSAVFPDPPRAAGRLREVLDRDDTLILSLTDRGTTGLGGPVRADRPPRRHEPSNFVDLLFNIGQPAPREFGGGTYGFGRTIAFVVSEARAVIVYSRTRVGRGLESRLIASAFSDHYTERSQRFTGRHWWGRSAGGSVEPVVGDHADQLAASLGLVPFAPEGAGTTIAVIAPDLRGRAPAQAFRFLAGALTWNFWPKMVDGPAGGGSLRFTVTLDGEDVAIPDPANTPPLHAFVASLRAVHAAEAGALGASPLPIVAGDLQTRVDEVVLPRTGERIGWMALTRCPVRERPTVDEGVDEETERGPSAAVDGPAHHVALIRHPELVVEHLATAELATPPHPSGWSNARPGARFASQNERARVGVGVGAEEYAGVFKPVASVDRAFARAEPPTHDAWNPNLVPETKLRRFVNVALRTIREITTAYAEQRDDDDRDASRRIARTIDTLFASPSEREEAAGPTVVIEAAQLVDRGGVRIGEVHFVVTHAVGSAGTVIDASTGAATHDGWTLDRSTASPGDVLGFATVDGVEVAEAHRLSVAATGDARWTVRVQMPSDDSLAVDLRARAFEDE